MHEHYCDNCKKKIDNTNYVLSDSYDIGDGIKLRITELFFKEGSDVAMKLCIDCHREYLRKFIKSTVEKGIAQGFSEGGNEE